MIFSPSADEFKFSQVLDVSSNLIVSISEDVFSQLPALHSLSLNFCLLESLPNNLGCCSSLVTLEIQDNCLDRLPSSIGNLFSLKMVDIGQNNLRSLPDNIKCLENLQELLLNNNKLMCLGTSLFRGLSKLTCLDLSFNQIELLPDDIDCLVSLTHLLLSNNLLKTLPQSVAALSTLKVLKLSNNQLSSLPLYFGRNLSKLTELALDSNKLVYIPESLAEAENLEYLDFHSNMISELPAKIGMLTRLTILNMRNNRLAFFPSELSQLVSLRVLDLSDNQLHSLPPSIASLNLSALWLASNQARPLVPLDLVWGEEGPNLTCFLLPQSDTFSCFEVSNSGKMRSFSRQVSFCCEERTNSKQMHEEEKCTATSAEVLPKVKTKLRRSTCGPPQPQPPVENVNADDLLDQRVAVNDKPNNLGRPHHRSMPQSPILKMVQNRMARIFQPHNYTGLSSSTDSL